MDIDEILRKHNNRSGIRRWYKWDTNKRKRYWMIEITWRGKVLAMFPIWRIRNGL